ncbi:adenosine deaminase [Lutibacter citreus]|uniref:adenosine deaminase n=1 Tax=Lutibacter citreus TaxID=2138210 RepID=UPI000DBEA8ED|nr:adenosine deaminase [Lutibacter citreus]
MDTFINNLPKAELHVHIEGTLEPELLLKLATRNNIKLPYKTINEIKNAYDFNCLQDFLDIYYQGAKVLITENDFFDLTYSYFEKSALQNVKHLEIMFDPQTHTNRGVTFETVISGISRACDMAEEKLGVTSILIMSYLRHLSENEAFKTLQSSLPFKELITSVGLDSSEKDNPPSKFQNVFKASVKEGYIPVAHAGEEGNSDYIWEALNLLEIKRIDHGNNCLQDINLVNEIIKRDIALTICPLSNISLKVVENLEDHPLKEMLQLGLNITINSDDPAYFGGHINKNYQKIQQALNLSKLDIYGMAQNSFKYSFLNDDKKEQYLNDLEVYYNKNIDL